MRVSFYDILSSHSRAYPQMMAEDYYALAYESEYGEVFQGDNDVTRYLLEKAEYIKNDCDFENKNDNVVFVYVKSIS